VKEEKVQWIREGECNHCGDCCLFLIPNKVEIIIQIDELGRGKDDWHNEVRGVVPDKQRPGFYRGQGGLYSPCREFNREQYRCNIHPNKPTTCIDYPWHPDQIKGFDRCSYTFKRADEDVLGAPVKDTLE